ncbi:hypothetical protein SAMN05421693_1211 [Ectothiorhodospira magna]|uniref:Transposase n=1 Tax=Ectothiorhodospira magna TaxID=867345 RepID=A0A1H9EAL0_9GAMM|nr:hypothetical protein SAMN05421693_1211 [Ectothiorhodospira magna]
MSKARDGASPPTKPDGLWWEHPRRILVEKANFSVVVLCRVMQVSRSGYYAWCQRGPDPDRIRRLDMVKSIHDRISNIF